MMTPFNEPKHLSIPFQDIKVATNNFTDVIGSGGFGPVYRGQLSLSGELTVVAVKRLPKENISGQGLKEFLTEIHLLSRLKHPNLISLVGFCKEGDENILVYEYAERGSLDKYLTMAETATTQLTWKQRITICIDAAQCLDYLHNHVAEDHRVIHRDIKSANILLDHNWKAKIADFGLSKIGLANNNDSFVVTNYCGTDGYLDPEYRRTIILTKESDIYSFGVVLFEVLCSRLSYPNVQNDSRYLDQLARRCYEEQKLDDIIDPSLKNQIDSSCLYTYSKIAYECLHNDRRERPSTGLVVQRLKDALKFQLLSDEIKSQERLFQGNWIPISLPESWDQDVPTSNQSELRVLSNLVATGALNSAGVLDDIFWEHMVLTVNILRRKKSDYNDMLVKCLWVIKKLLENNGGGFGDLHIRHWVAIVELHKEVSGCTGDASGRLLYESVACITIILSGIAQRLKSSLSTEHADVATNDLQEILDHAKASDVTDALLSCLVTCGTSLMSGSSKHLRAACEACEAIWSLIDAFEIQSANENAVVFPLSSMYSHSLDRLNIIENECEPLIGKDSEKVVEAVTQAFLRSEAIQVAIFYCLRQRLEAAWSSVIQIILRCCLHNDSFPRVLCGLSSSSVVDGGGDNTIVSEVFSILSLCASVDRDPQPGDTNNLKSKVSNPCDLILHSCLFVATVAQSLDSFGRNTAVIMLTSSRKTQQSRLSDLAHHYSFCDGIQDIQPYSMSAMLALAYICSLENNESAATSIREIALPLIPPSAILCDYLRMSTTDTQGDKIMLSYWHGFRDGCVVLLYFRIFWGRCLAIPDIGGSDIPQSLIDLLGNKHSDEIGLSPLGVMWTVTSLMWCLQGGSSVFRQVLLAREHVKILCDLISDIHLKLIRGWVGFGGGKNGVGNTVNRIVDLLGFPFVASVKSKVLRNMEPHDREYMVKEIKKRMEEYIQILLEVGFPGQIMKILDHLELKDTQTPVGLLSEMVGHRSLVVELVSKGLFNPNLMKRLLDDSSPTQVKLNVLKIVSKVAGMDKEFYEHINGADILQRLKACLAHEDPYVRGRTGTAIGEMCRHSSFFYSLLAKHNLISMLVDLLFDKHNFPQTRASFAIASAASHSDFFYEDLRICIPQLANLLRSAEYYQSKIDAATCLGNLCCHSDKLSEDMISKGAIEALLQVVTDFAVRALDSSRIDANNELVLSKALDALAKMVVHRSLVVELVSKGLLNPNLMKRLLDDSSPTQVKLMVLIIVSKVAGMDKEFYEHINGADILQRLKACLAHEDPYVRGRTGTAIGEMCRHSSFFYSLLAKHNLISMLVDLLFDKHNFPQTRASFAIASAASHSDFFYEDLRICIPQLANLLRSAEYYQSKIYAATCLGNLCCHSDKLSEDMISEGAMEALLQVVTDFAVRALDSSRIDANNELVLSKALDALAKMVVHRSLVVELVSKGLLNPNIMKRLLDRSSPTQVKLVVLVIVSRVAGMDKEFYEHINGADILQRLKACLAHEDPYVRGWTGTAIGEMCRHSSFFYSLLAKHNLISMLVDLLFDKHNFPQTRASFAIASAASHSDFFYEDLRICIPQLANLLRSAEYYQSKIYAATFFGNLCYHSDKLSEDMISKGAMEALLQVVKDFPVRALDPSKIDANNELVLSKALEALARIVVHRSLVVELVSKGLLNPNLMKRLLDDSSPTQVKLMVLIIVSTVAGMDKEFYEHINGADILQRLKACLAHEDPYVRGWTGTAIGEMCRHSSFFYSLLAKHNLISMLVDLLFDKHNFPQTRASFAIASAASHSDFFYEDLRICIPQLANLLRSAEYYQSKIYAATFFGNLCYHSDKLSEDMISKGAMEALLQVVKDFPVRALDPSKIDANNELVLSKALEALARIVVHRSLVVELVSKGLLNPNLMKRLLDDSSPTQVKLMVLIIVSTVAGMDKEFYEHINGADILEQLKACLTHEDPYVRGWTCSAIGEMCWHSSYFYTLLAKHNIISMLVDLLFDKHNFPQTRASFAIGCTASHSDLFYEDLRICIPQLANLLRSAETTNETKESAATCLGNLSHHSDKLSEDMISKGAMEALLKVVTDCSVVALDPSRIDADNQLLWKALCALATMCIYPPCRKVVGSSEVYPVIGQLHESPVEKIVRYATSIFNRASET